MEKTARALWPARRRWRRKVGYLVLALSPTFAGCEKKSPPDLQLQEGYRLLESDPKAAYDALGKAKNPGDPRVLLGRGLALERLKQYEEAEKLLLQAVNKANEPVSALPLARVHLILGKADEARKVIDAVVAAAPGELSALLLSTCLASDDARAQAALAHLQKWSDLSKEGKTTPSSVPSEYYLAKKVLFAQLDRREEFEEAAKKAAGTKLTDKRSVFSLVELAVKAGRRDLAMELLRKINDEDQLGEHKTRVAKLAHGLGDHRLVESILHALPGGSADLLILRAEHKFVTGQPQADVPLRRALEVTKDDTTKARLWTMLAESLLRDEKPEEARKEADELAKKYPSAEARVLVARIDLALGKPALALEQLEPLLGQNEVPAAAQEVAASAHLELGHTEKARVRLSALLEKVPEHLRAAELATSLELRAGQPKEAVRLARELSQKRPDNVGLVLLYAEITRQAEGDEAAISVMKSASNEVKQDPRLWVTLAQAIERKGDEAEALRILEEAHAKLPSANVVTLALAARLGKAGDKKRATILYEALISQAEGNPLALNNLAMLYADEGGNEKRAVELAEQAHRLSSAPGIVDTLGWALFKRGSDEDKKRALELLTSVRSKLTSPTSKFHLAAVQIATGEPEKGKQLLRQALAQQGDFPEAEQARQLLSSVP